MIIKSIFNQFGYLAQDIRRWECKSLKGAFYIAFEQGLWGAVFFRFSRVLFVIDIPVIKVFLRFFGFIFFKFSETFLGVAIPPGVNVGPGLHIGHGGSIILHPEVKAGRNLSLGPGVVIGQRGRGCVGVPVLGDDVYIGVGAKLLGDIRIGNNVNIGANAVVIHDVPDGATVVGVPAMIVKTED